MTTISFKLVKVVILSEKVVILSVAKLIRTVFEIHNNIARYNLINSKYCQMEFQSPSDGAPISPHQQSFGTPGQTKVSGDRQRETTHEFCCLTAKLNNFMKEIE